jgi:hypothetical protein
MYQFFSQGPEYSSSETSSRRLGETDEGGGPGMIATSSEKFFVAINDTPTTNDNVQLHIYTNTGAGSKIIS